MEMRGRIEKLYDRQLIDASAFSNYGNLTAALWGKIRSFWDINNALSHELGSEWVSERVNEMSAVDSASEASSAEQANERAVQANKQTDERMAQ